MKNPLKYVAPLILSASLAACHGIGTGSTVQSLKIVLFPVSGEQGALLTPVNSAVTQDTLKMFDCFCSTVKVYGYFTDGIVGDFTTRVTLTSSDPSIVRVTRFDLTTPCGFFQNDPLLWSLIPSGTPGTATLTAEFLGLKNTLNVQVVTTSTGTFTVAPTDTTNTGQVAVGTTLPLTVTVDLDNRTRTLNSNLTGTATGTSGWTLSGTDADDNHATISKTGVFSGIAASVDGPISAQPNFGACPAFTTTLPALPVSVGDIVFPLTLEEEPGFTTDHMLAVNSGELMKVTAALDFDDNGTADGSQLISGFTSLSFTDSCTVVDHDPADTTGTTCRFTPRTDCPSSPAIPKCGNSSPTSCATTMTACRTAASPISAGLGNRIVAVGDNGSPTLLTAMFPLTVGTATTLAADITDPNAITLSATALTGYPTIFPWFAVIDQAGSREDVMVTARDGTTLTVVRGIAGTARQTHLAGVTFNQRSYTSDPLNPVPVTAKTGTLNALVIDNDPNTSAPYDATYSFMPPLSTLQLHATGTFDDSTDADPARQQHVERLVTVASGSPAVNWTSSNSKIIFVAPNAGFLTSQTVCGGKVSIRARATTSTDTTTKAFDKTDPTLAGNCGTSDPLCSQVNLCIATPATLPEGATCTTTTTCP